VVGKFDHFSPAQRYFAVLITDEPPMRVMLRRFGQIYGNYIPPRLRGPQSQRQHHGARLYLGVLFSSMAEYIPLDFHSVSPALRAGRMDRPGRPEGDNDIVEQYYNPSKELSLPRAP
jgi:hypothetical protein